MTQLWVTSHSLCRSYQADIPTFSTEVHGGRTRDNGNQWKQRRFQPDVWNNLFCVRTAKQQKGLTRDAVRGNLLRGFQT